MHRDEEKFESYLRGFRPRRPRALAMAAPRGARRWMAVAACATLGIGGAWFALQGGLGKRGFNGSGARPAARPASEFSIAVSARGAALALAEDPESLDARLNDISRRLLPDVEQADGALYELGRK